MTKALPSLQGEGLGVGSVLLLFMFAFVYSKITLQRYKKGAPFWGTP